MLHEVVHDNNFNSSVIDHASMPLRIFASKSVSLSDWQIRPTFKNLAASLPSRLAAKKVAFTLAEVLITLGIIGVVAALTLPTVIKNYQKQVTITRLQKAYSILGQVAQKSIVDKGAIDFVDGEPLDESKVREFFNTYWLQNFKGVYVYPENKIPKLNGNTPVYRYISGILNVDDTTIYTSFPNGRIFFSTSDGMSFFVLIMKWGISFNDKGEFVSKKPLYNSQQSVIVDINGVAPPNTNGKDVFYYYVDFSNGKVSPGGGNSCSKTASGMSCAKKIMQDGWKIKSDYPW